MAASPSQTPCDFSLILPGYNAATLIERSLPDLRAFLDTLDLTSEIIYVDDGSSDDTVTRVDALRIENLTMIRQPANLGKGAAVRAGMLAASGRYRIFTDIDLPYALDSITRCLEQFQTANVHAVFGSRRVPGAENHTDLPIKRRLGHLVFRLAVGLLIGRFDLDTQAGFKGFSAELVEKLFPLLTVDRFGFDVEIYMLLAKAGIDFFQIPITLVNHDLSTITVLGSGLQTFLDLGVIWWRNLRGDYDLRTLQTLSTPPQEDAR